MFIFQRGGLLVKPDTTVIVSMYASNLTLPSTESNYCSLLNQRNRLHFLYIVSLLMAYFSTTQKELSFFTVFKYFFILTV